MPVRDRIAGGLTALAKRFGGAVPPQIAAGEQASGMTPATALGPGAPIQPYDGYSRTPRGFQYTPSYNISAKPRSHERIAFSTLQGLIEAYDIAQICIWHRIDSIRSLEWSLVAADGYEGDVTDAVKLGIQVLRKPDRKTPFDAWLAEYLYDVLAYDAGTLSRMRNRLGQVVGLRVIDGTTIAPLLDEWGDIPEYPAEGYVQYINGLPWNWLTDRDLIYQPFRKKPNSPYGHAPLEALLLNANTDLRFQAYFLQKFTEGNIPHAFASAPETWTPDQIEQFQQNWDALMRGDQEILSQIKWIPGGGKIAWSNDKDFSDAFSLFMMRKTAAGYHVVPADLGFTETVNKSAGETQSDVQHRLGDTPLAKHASGVLTSFLQDDLHLPIKHQFDLGEEQDDRLATAQSDFIYWRMGSVGTSEIREMRFGLSEAGGKPVPRTFFTERSGPIPISALDAVAGPVDRLTGAPEPGATPPGREFQPVEGVVSTPPPNTPPLAEQIYGPEAIAGIAQPVAKETAGMPEPGITAETGIYGYDLVGRDDDEEDDDAASALAKSAEVAAFRRYVKQSRRMGRPWRDFTFTATDRVAAHRLNDSGRLALRKQAGQVAVAGLAVLAADTGRVLMLQRALCDDDPAAGCWEFPGGHLEADEGPLQGAAREWAEETGCTPPSGHQTGTWTSADGVYQGIVWTVPGEAGIPVFDGRDQFTNPDDPDGDQVEALAWWDPAQLPGNPAVRPELLASIDQVLAALDAPVAKSATLSKAQAHYRDPSDLPGRSCGNCSMFRAPADGSGAGACTLVKGAIDAGAVCDRWDARSNVAKAGGGDPKAPPPDQGEPVAQAWPGWQYDLAAVAYWAPLIATGLGAAVSAKRLAEQFLATAPASSAGTKAQRLQELTAIAQQFLDERRALLTDGIGEQLADVLAGLYADGGVIGASAATAAVDAAEAGKAAGSVAAEVGPWVVGDTEAAQLLLSKTGAGDGLRALLDEAGITIKSIAHSRLDELARVLAQAVERGDSAGTIARDIRSMLTDPSRAQMIATTELCRAVSAASAHTYRQRGVTEVTWSTAYDERVCLRCDANEAVGDHPLGIPFPSGAVYPPQHPWCRCALLPAVSSEGV